MKQHKWHKEIKAWADGAVIECQNVATGEWEELEVPYWYESNEYKYRIKSQPKESQYLYVYKINNVIRLIEGNGYLEVGNQNEYVEYIGKIKLESNDD